MKSLRYNRGNLGFSEPLHALRGIAALAVFVRHLYERVNLGTLAYGQPLFIPVNAQAAVTFFFVLSGLVIGLSLTKRPLTNDSVKKFLIRRLYRIMPLMALTVTIGGLYLAFIDERLPFHMLPTSYGDLTPAKFLSAYIGYSIKPNPPIWSIFIELIASLLLPLMVFTSNNKMNVIITGAVLFVFASLSLGFQHNWNFYIFDFYAGLTILFWGKRFSEWLSGFHHLPFAAIILLLFLMFVLPRFLWDFALTSPIPNLLEVVFISPIVAVIYYRPEKFRCLKRPTFQFLGEISFSLYLTHFLLVALLFNFIMVIFPSLDTQPSLALWLLASVSMPVVILVAAATHHFIEKPGIEAGKSLKD